MKAIDYCEKIFDGTHDSPKPNAEGKHYLINSKNISTGQIDYNGAYKISDDDYNKIIKRSGVKKGDILISMIGTIGNLCIVDDDSPDYAIKNMGVFRCKNSVDRNKLFYYLQTNDFKQKSNNFLNSSIQKFLTLDFIRNLDIQKEILDKIDVDKLTRVDLLIKHKNDVINVLINKIKDQYSFYISNCSDEIQKLKLSDLLEEDNEKIDSNSKKLLIDLAAMPSSSLVIYNYGDSNKLTTNKTILKKGNILIGLIRPYLKKCLISPIDGVTTGTIGQFKIKDEKLQDFIVGIVTSDSFTNYLISVSTGTKMPVVKTSDILNYQISVDQSLLRKCNFTNTVNEIIVLNNENYKLTMLKSDYLNKLFN